MVMVEQIVPHGTVSSGAVIDVPDESAVIPLEVPNVPPGEVYRIRAEKGSRDTVVTRYDLDRATVSGGAVAPIWSDPKKVIAVYGLNDLVEACERVVLEVFGGGASVRPAIEQDPESGVPSLILWIKIPRDMRPRRWDYLDWYARETVIPQGAPAPVILWEYGDAVHP